MKSSWLLLKSSLIPVTSCGHHANLGGLACGLHAQGLTLYQMMIKCPLPASMFLSRFAPEVMPYPNSRSASPHTSRPAPPSCHSVSKGHRFTPGVEGAREWPGAGRRGVEYAMAGQAVLECESWRKLELRPSLPPSLLLVRCS